MNKGKRLVKNTLIISIGKFSTQIVSFLLLPLYTSLLSDSEYGTFDYIASLAVFLVPLVTLLMEEAMFRFLIDADTEEKKKNTITQSVVLVLFNSIIMSVILYVIFEKMNYGYTIYLILYMLASIYNSFSQAFCRGIGRIKLYSISAFCSSSLTLILNVIFIVYFKFGLRGLLLGFIISNLITPTIIFIKLKIWQYSSLKRVDFNEMKIMLKYSIPLVPNSVSWSIINLSDRLIVTNYLGAGANGILAVAHKFPNMMNTVYGYFYTAWKEEASRAIKEEEFEKFYNYIYDMLNRILITVSLGLISIMPLTFNILVNIKFNDAYKYIPFLVVAMYFGNISGFYGGIFSANKKTKIMGTTTIFSAFINIVLNVVLIKRLGIYATILSTFVANVVVCIYRFIKLKEFVTLKNNYYLYCSAIIILTINIICYYSFDIWMFIVGFGIFFLYALTINRNIISMLFNKFLKRNRR